MNTKKICGFIRITKCRLGMRYELAGGVGKCLHQKGTTLAWVLYRGLHQLVVGME